MSEEKKLMVGGEEFSEGVNLTHKDIAAMSEEDKRDFLTVARLSVMVLIDRGYGKQVDEAIETVSAEYSKIIGG